MRNHRLTACFTIAIIVLLFTLLPAAQCQNYCEYNVQIRSDGSALWTITQFSSLNTATDTWDSFQLKIFNLVESAASLTHREMAVNENSIQIDTSIASESQTTKYSFLWQNFSKTEGSKLSLGDVFAVNNFFGQLYGDAALELTYPADFQVLAVNPSPYEQQDSTQTLQWSRTQDLTSGSVSIVLTSSPIQNAAENGRQFGFVAVLALAVALPSVSFYLFKRQRKKASKSAPVSSVETLLETEEDKVVKLLKSVGGSMRQSEITERCRFSKAKTSQLLTEMEKRGILARYKKGRDKIVTLKERVKGEK